MTILGQIVLDLVPSSWVVNTGEEYFTVYPPKKDHARVSSWCLVSKEPNPTWLKYPVKIMGKADTHEEGMHRMERAYEESDISSAAESVQNEQSAPAPLTNNQASDVLNTLGETITCTSDNLPEAS
ncbi:hypothetical protein PV327_011581, partial [Microctonus hyperodae]